MKSIKIAGGNDNFKNYLINLLELADLHYDVYANKNNTEIKTSKASEGIESLRKHF